MIYQWDRSTATPDQVVADFFGVLCEPEPQPVDTFAVGLFRSVAERADELDATIRRYALGWSPERMSLIVRHLLRLAISEMHSGTTPATVVINETLEIGKRFAGNESTAFLNGVLEAVRRELARTTGSTREPGD